MLNIAPSSGFNDARYESLRTEDVKFSPSGRLLAIVSKNIIVLSCISIDSDTVRITRTVEMFSEGLECAHGIDFISEDVLVVANREGWITFFNIPPMAEWTDTMTIPVLHEHRCDWFGPKKKMRVSGVREVRCGPGAVRIRGNRFFVGTNNENTVTIHDFAHTAEGITTSGDTLFAQEDLEIPDGLTISNNGKYLAVSNLHYSKVMVYDLEDGQLLCELMDVDLHCPHGLCFDRSDSVLYAADAGNKYIHEFRTFDGWKTSMDECTYKIAAVDQAAFELTKSETPDELKYLEGGMKGIDIDPTGQVLASTCRHQPLRFFKILSNYFDASQALEMQDS